MRFSYPKSLLRKNQRTSAEWKLNWLEEINRLTFQGLSRKAKRFREKVRRGDIEV